MRAVPQLCIVYPGICLTTEEKSLKNLSQVNRRTLDCSAPNALRLVDLAITGNDLDWPVDPCRPWLLRQATESTLGQLSICRVAVLWGSPHQLTFESKLSVRALMWSANSGTPKSSCICLLLTYQEATVARRRHLDCNTCNLRIWERAADLHAGLE